MSVTVRLLGQAQAGEHPLPSDKRGLLLAYLACHGAWVNREHLAVLFWPDSDEAGARRNLRQLLNRVKALPAANGLELSPTQVRWRVDTDLARFRQAVARQHWEEALALYRGELLATLAPRDAAGFEAWLELERDNLRSAYRDAALHHARALESAGTFDRAAEQLKLLLDGDELAEDVLQAYLKTVYLAGKRDLALTAFEAFARRLRDELGLEPLEATLGLVTTIRAAAPLEPGAAAGQPAPAAPLNVLRPPRLVGRHADAASARAARTSVVIFRGEAGVGKSRLLSELASQALVLRCREGWQAVPYQPVITLIRDRLARGCPLPDLGGYLDDLLRLVPDLDPAATPGPVEVQTAKARLLEALSRYLEGACDADADFQLVMDDLHWADAASLELLAFLGGRPGLRILGAIRRHEGTPELAGTLDALRSNGALTVLELNPLQDSQVRELMADLMGVDEGPPVFSRWLHRATGGNPMFALETLKSFFETGVLRADRQGWHTSIDQLTQDYGELEVPPAVGDVIARRVGRLAGETVRVLQTASVVRQGFTPELLAGVAGLSAWAVLDALEEADDAGLVQGEQFRHDLIRQSIYASIPVARRKLLHGRVAQALDRGAEPLVLAEHWLAAGDAQRAGTQWQRAAARLRDQGLHAEAIDILARAVAQAPPGKVTWSLQAELAKTYRQAAHYERAEALAEALLDGCSDPLLRASALDTRAGVFLQQGQLDRAEEAVEDGLRTAGGDPDLQRSLRNLKAYVAFYRGRYDEARLLIEPMVAALREARDEHELCSLLISLATIYDRLDRQAEALPLHQEALALARRTGAKHQQVDSALNLLFCYMDLGRTVEGLPAAEEALSLGRYEGTDTLRNNVAAALVELGRHEEALHHYEVLVRESDDPTLLCIAWARLARLYARFERPRQAEHALDQALELAARTEFEVARAAAAISAYGFGSEQHMEAASRLAETLDRDALPAYQRDELERALAGRLT